VSVRTVLPLATLAAASAWCIGLLAVRRYELGSLGYPWMVWNLTLAWVPLLVALGLLAAQRRARPSRELVLLGCVWLLFLPNAPYVLTDFVHLGYEHRVFDSLVLGSFAAAACALGFASVVIVQAVVTRARGSLAGWAVAAVSLVASSVGIYLGRVQRLNSWDALTHPGRLWTIARTWLENPLGHGHLMLVVAGLAVFLTLSYLGLYALTSLATLARDAPPDGRRAAPGETPGS
jgi:uncharacterized membrane protein